MKKIRFIAALIALVIFSGMFVAVSFAEEAEPEWWNILLMGGDSRSKTDTERTDCMIILSINPETNELKMSSIMRDIWVDFPGTNKSHRINAANVYGGPELAMKTVNYYFGTDITDYILVNMTNLIGIIDKVGGVDIEITGKERELINSYAEAYINETGSYSGDRTIEQSGLVHLNGLLAMSYTRNRYSDSDFGRVMRQQKVLLAIAAKLQDLGIDELLMLASDMMTQIDTNLDVTKIEKLAKVGLVADPEDVGSLRLPVDGTFSSGLYNGTYKIKPNFAENARLLHEFIYSDAD